MDIDDDAAWLLLAEQVDGTITSPKESKEVANGGFPTSYTEATSSSLTAPESSISSYDAFGLNEKLQRYFGFKFRNDQDKVKP